MTSLETPDAGSARAVRFSRRLGIALFLGVAMIVLAAFGPSYWMARKQDALAEVAADRMVIGGLDAFADRARTTLLDYTNWTAAYDRIRAADRRWVYDNIGNSADIGTMDLVVILPGNGKEYGWRTGQGTTPQTGLLDDATIGALQGALAAAPLDGGAQVAYARSGGALWLLAIARTAPQDGVPSNVSDAMLPRQIFGFEMTPERLRLIGERFLVPDLAIAASPSHGLGSVALRDAAGRPLAHAVWTPPEPGLAVLRTMLWPVLGLGLLAAAAALLGAHALVAAAQRLEVALDRAQRADRSKTEFLANVSHELRTPMNGVIGIAQLLQMQDLGAESQEMVGVLLASAHTQIRLINGLLDLTRIETGAMQLDAAPFDPSAAVEETVGLLGPEAAAKGVALSAAIAPDSRGAFVGDGLAVRQVLVNLIGNAVKFTDAGRIDVELSATETGLALSVADTGRGVAPEDQSRIFERFVQVDGSLTRRAGGAGLGLAITRSLVELMGGTIRLTSAVGAGATFVVALPLARASATQSRLAA